MMKFSSFQESRPKSENLQYENKNSLLCTQNSVRFCTNCGSKLELGDVFCDECGSKIEQDENLVILEEDNKIFEKNPIEISSDRMASIIQTNKMKQGEVDEDFIESTLSAISSVTETKEVKIQKELEEKAKLLGYYVFKDSFMTQYLIIENINGNNVKASVKTTFTNGGYSTEFYEGVLFGDELHLNIVDYDLHPPTAEMQFYFNTPKIVNYTIQLSEKFDGIINKNEITGSFSGHFSKSLVFKKC